MKKLVKMNEAEEPCRESEHLYRTIFETSGSAMIVVEENMGISLVNHEFEKISGYLKYEIENKKKLTQFIGEKDLPRVTEYHQKRRFEAASVPANYEFKFINRQGIIRDMHIKVNMITGTKKSVISFVDITDQKLVEENVNNSKSQHLSLLQAMFEAHTACMLLTEPLNGKISDANPAACNFYGYTKSELLNMNISDINLLPKADSEKMRFMALHEKQRYFLFPHRLKSGEMKLVDVYSSPVTHKGEKKLFSIIFDVTDRENYKEELYLEKELLRTTLLSISDGVITTDPQGRITSINKAAERHTGWTPEEAQGRPLEEVFRIINEFTREKNESSASKVLTTGDIIELSNHTILISKDGIERPIEDSAAPIKGEDNKISGVVLIFRDMAEKKERQAKIEYLSYHDQLTELYNRKFFEEEIVKLDTEDNLPITLVIGDINGLNLTNDAFGHLAGDKLLQRVAAVIKQECRADDIVARFGGDEFVILLPKTEGEEARIILKRINESLLNGNEDAIPISISFGWETKRDPSEEMAVVFKQAEDYMYRRKLSESASMRNKTVKVIIKTLYEKNEREQQHSARVSKLCAAIGTALGLRGEDISELRTVGLLHDIGKIVLDDRILDKAGNLSNVEITEIKRHAETSYRILSSVNEFAQLAEYVLAHHERWDGKGYPKGLKGYEIPLHARIIAVADAYDAMTSDRPYRKALSVETAIEEIKVNAGIQFDPDISRVFLENIKQWHYIFDEHLNNLF